MKLYFQIREHKVPFILIMKLTSLDAKALSLKLGSFRLNASVNPIFILYILNIGIKIMLHTEN